MLELMQEYIRRHDLWQEQDHLILGLSAGADSMALLDLIKRLTASGGLSFAVAHVNYGLRPEADAEQEFIEALCQKDGTAFYFHKLKPGEITGSSWEDQARIIRYRFFEKLRSQTGAAAVLTAHHRNDTAETMLLHLLRGSGLKGLRGILPRNGYLRRPLLFAAKAEIYRYAKERELSFYEDKTNRDLRYTRNRVRHQLLPMLEDSFNPQIVEALNDLAEIIRAEDEAAEAAISVWWERAVITEKEGELELKASLIESLPLAWQRRLLLRALQRAGGLADRSFSEVEAVRGLLAKKGSAKRIHLKKELIVFKVYDKIVFSVHQPEKEPLTYRINVEEPGIVTIPALQAKYHFTILARPEETKAGVWHFDYDKMGWPMVLRSREAGDRITLRGLTGTKKLKKLFMERRIPERDRAHFPLLTSPAGKVYGILELGIIDNAVAVTNSTRQVLRVEKINSL